MKVSPVPLLVAALLGLSPAAVASQPRLVVGVEDQHYLPVYSYDNGAYTGFARELLDAFARDRGYVLEYRPLPVPRLYAAFLNGQVDLKFPDNPNWKMDLRQGRAISYSEPVAAFVDGVSVLPDRLASGVGQVRRLGTMAGFTPWAWLDLVQAGKVSVVENSSFEALVRQTLLGRIDGVYANVAVINYQLDRVVRQPGGLRFDSSLPYSRDHYYLSSIKAPAVVADFNDWMKQNRSRIQAMKQKHAVEKGVMGD